MLLAAVLALSACSPSEDQDRGELDRPPTTRGPAPDHDADETGASTDLERDRSDAATELERRVSDTLSQLEAEMRGDDTVVTLPDNVLFDYDQHDLRPSAADVLDDLAEVMIYFDGAPVQVNGHTDSMGDTGYNQGLSERRAQTVVDYLILAGIDESRLTAEGFGESQPVAPNTLPDGSDDPDGRAQNRRVEIIIEGVDFNDLPPPTG